MMKNLLLIISLILVSSCDSGKKKKSSDKTQSREELGPQQDEVANGIYSSGCVDDYAGSYIDRFEFTDGQLEITNTSYYEKGCVTGEERDRFRSLYDYALYGDFLSLSKKQYFYIFYAPDELQEYNEGEGYCGIPDWEENQERDITALDCDGEIFSPTEIIKTPSTAYSDRITIAGKTYHQE